MSKLLVDGIATFSCAEFCEYTELITYAFVANLLYLKRNELQKSIIDGSEGEVLQVMMEIPLVVSVCVVLVVGLCLSECFHFLSVLKMFLLHASVILSPTPTPYVVLRLN